MKGKRGGYLQAATGCTSRAQSEEAKEDARDTRAVTRAEDALDLKSVLQNEISASN